MRAKRNIIFLCLAVAVSFYFSTLSISSAQLRTPSPPGAPRSPTVAKPPSSDPADRTFSSERTPDLKPANPSHSDEATAYCAISDGASRKLKIFVENTGIISSSPSKTSVLFSWRTGSRDHTSTVMLDTPPIEPGRTKMVDALLFPKGCLDSDCHFTITVDSESALLESNEKNNSAQGLCRGRNLR